MPSSGTGNSWSNDFKQCMQLGFNRHVRKIQKVGQPPFAPPLVVGEAIHAYAEAVLKEWMSSQSKNIAKRNAEDAFGLVLNPYAEMARQYADLEIKLEERAGAAGRVLPVWFEMQWDRLEAGLDVPIAVEVPIEIDLPRKTPFGPIAEHLAKFTGRIDLVLERRDDLEAGVALGLTARDFKSTTANDVLGMLASHYRSDQHLGYAWMWNAMHADRPITQIEYSAIRIKEPINAKSFGDVRRPVRQAQLDDWFTRTCALRAQLTRLWPEPDVYEAATAWPQNNTNNGPCHVFGSRCDYWDACESPGRLITELGYEPRHDDTP